MMGHLPADGIIHPPLHIRLIVEDTASFVAKHGPEFERQIVEINVGNPKFNFLIESDPYHYYYEDRLSELQLDPFAPRPVPPPAHRPMCPPLPRMPPTPSPEEAPPLPDELEARSPRGHKLIMQHYNILESPVLKP
ncbi:putative splicing factor 3A subunit 1 [Apostasia shenzhenica]|uniref:Putative splicing factor 3A subunit 1 n=1 Tax=Apostasia shenzhenica TaxID=1088818 RepID=A0A2H9ZVI6_9ASPA|nr:putative splicing factor 3A subunit 1 [Apostasia shenzhenica]